MCFGRAHPHVISQLRIVSEGEKPPFAGITQENSGYWDASFNGNDGSGSVSFTFTNNSGSDAHLQIADGTVGQSGAGWFKGGVTASWTNGSATTIAAAKTSVGGGFAISTFLADNASDVLTLTWGDARGFKSDIDFTVAAVPLPAGVLLLGTALVGMGAFASRRKTA